MIKLRKLLFQVAFLFGCLFFLVAVTISVPAFLLRTAKMSPEVIFRQYILEPIPQSVTNIKADQPKDIGGYTYTFRFKINRADLNLILESKPFQRVWNTKYYSGMLDWGWDRDGPLGYSTRGQGMSIYGSGFFRREPRWFRPGRWANPEAYVFYKAGDLVNVEAYDSKPRRGRQYITVLLYNEDKGEAYCVVTRYRL
jgi:hypothetical protein